MAPGFDFHFSESWLRDFKPALARGCLDHIFDGVEVDIIISIAPLSALSSLDISYCIVSPTVPKAQLWQLSNINRILMSDDGLCHTFSLR